MPTQVAQLKTAAILVLASPARALMPEEGTMRAVEFKMRL